jgi:nitrite reductase/ring-hydroxylating ferredoxin subunit
LGRWVRAAAASDIPPGSAKAVLVEGRWFALYRDADGEFHATDDACPHEGASLAEGTYYEGRVICRKHDWVFDVRTGDCLRMPLVRLACYATRPAGDGVEIEIDDGASRTPCR